MEAEERYRVLGAETRALSRGGQIPSRDAQPADQDQQRSGCAGEAVAEEQTEGDFLPGFFDGADDDHVAQAPYQDQVACQGVGQGQGVGGLPVLGQVDDVAKQHDGGGVVDDVTQRGGRDGHGNGVGEIHPGGGENADEFVAQPIDVEGADDDKQPHEQQDGLPVNAREHVVARLGLAAQQEAGGGQ